ncbi:MAG: transposase [Bacteroidales bacterium]|nr:transposase [Bacteroidales bacterium]
MVKLTKKQLGEAIKTELQKENGLNDVFKLTLEGLMYLERSELLKDSEGNKGNGYRFKNSIGFGEGFRLSVPRDRLGVFQPYILELLKEDENRIKLIKTKWYKSCYINTKIEIQ